MLKRRQEQISILVRLLDMVVTVLAFFAAYTVRDSIFFDHLQVMGSLDSLYWVLLASLAIHLWVYPANGFYASMRFKSFEELALMTFRAGVTEFLILGALVFLFKEKAVSRYFFIFFIAFNYTLTLFIRMGAKWMLSSLRRRKYNIRQVVVVGTGENAVRVIRTLKKNNHWGYIPAGVLRELRSESKIEKIQGVKVLGTVNRLAEVVMEQPVDEVIFASDKLNAVDISEQVSLCEELGIPARVSYGLFELKRSKVTLTVLDDLPFITFYTTLMTPVQATLKRTVDILIALVGLFFTALLYPWVALRIKSQSPGPVIFKQERVGENGRRFKCYKFRTMLVGAEAQKKELQKKNKMQGPLFKMENDPRIFPFGAFLRRTSLDEFPQFFNVLRGDMSAVGTRPPTPDEVQTYKVHFRRRLSIRPGLTGMWQVSGRNRITDFEDVLALDLEYIDNWSVLLDIKILFKTVWVILFRRGAL